MKHSSLNYWSLIGVQTQFPKKALSQEIQQRICCGEWCLQLAVLSLHITATQPIILSDFSQNLVIITENQNLGEEESIGDFNFIIKLHFPIHQ